MINIIAKEISKQEVIYRDGFVECTLMGTPVIIEVIENDDWITMVIRNDHQPPMKFEGVYQDFPDELIDIIDELTVVQPVRKLRYGPTSDWINRSLDIFSKSLALK